MANLAEKIERYVEVGQTIHVDVIWRGQHYNLQMFFPGSTIPRKEDVQKQVQGVYPNAVVTRVVPATTDPTKPTIRVTNEGLSMKKNCGCGKDPCKTYGKQEVKEEGLRDWFGKSKSKDGKKGWVNVVTGDSCASDKPGEGIPKCVSSAKRASMSKKERRAAAAAKRREDPGQQRKSGAAAPTMVKTDRKKTKKEELELTDAYGEPFAVIQDLVKPEPMKREEPQIDLSTYDIEAMVEAKDKKGKGSGTKDACYHKVKSRYSVWPSAYASGALVKCRKVGASNWGNSKKEDYSYELNDEYYNTLFEKCWKGYEKKGMKTMFGKRYPNCVKKEEVEQLQEKPGDGYLGPTMKVGKKEYGVPNPIRIAKDAADNANRANQRKVDRVNKELGRGTASITPYKLHNKQTSKASQTLFGMQKQSYEPEGEMTEDKDPCWDTHKQVGMKKKGGKMVPNCVPKEEAVVEMASEKEIDKKLQKPVKKKDLNPAEYIRNTRLMPGSGIQKKLPEDWQKKSGKDPEGGLNEKGRKSYERENPGSDLKRPSKKVGNPRRKSFCARMKGMKKKLTSAKTANDPDSRINKSLRAWNC